MSKTIESSPSAEPLLQVLQEKVLPSLEFGVAARFVLATPTPEELVLPLGVECSRTPRTGSRVVPRGSRSLSRASYESAVWPDDHLHELRVPKIAFVVRGWAELPAGDYVLHCPEGYGIFMPPGIAHADGTRPHQSGLRPDLRECDILWLAPFANGLNCWICHSRGEEHLSPVKGEKAFLTNGQILQYLYAMQGEIADREALDYSILQGLLETMFRSIARDVRLKRFLVVGGASNIDWPDRDPLARAEQYIRSHLSFPLTLEEVARQAAMSRAQFTKKFRERTGQSFLEYTLDLRMDRARTLLRDTDWPVTEVARYAGFPVAAHFHRQFRKWEGLSALEYRAAERAKAKSKSH